MRKNIREVGWEKGRRDEGCVLWDPCSAEPRNPSGRCCSACPFCALSRSGFPLQFPGEEALEHQEQLQPALFPREILLDPAWALGKWLCALAGNTEKWKEKPERDRREIWHSSKAQTGWMLLPAAVKDLLLQSAEPSAGQEQLGWLCSFSCSGCIYSPSLCLPTQPMPALCWSGGNSTQSPPGTMPVLKRMLKNGAF